MAGGPWRVVGTGRVLRRDEVRCVVALSDGRCVDVDRKWLRRPGGRFGGVCGLRGREAIPGPRGGGRRRIGDRVEHVEDVSFRVMRVGTVLDISQDRQRYFVMWDGGEEGQWINKKTTRRLKS